VTNTKCRIDTVISPDDGHSRPKHVEKRNKHIKKNCAPSWLYLQKKKLHWIHSFVRLVYLFVY